MKIAVPTDDGKHVSPHFGRAQSFVIFEVNNGEVVSKEIIESNAPHARGEHAFRLRGGYCVRYGS
jgi:predicted Fe-Mo cluster-binding NifX family protein